MLTKAERRLRPLPTLAELEQVEELGGQFFHELENVALQVKSMDDAWNDEGIEPEALPTHEQIGQLYRETKAARRA
jgi:hypothetical protein